MKGASAVEGKGTTTEACRKCGWAGHPQCVLQRFANGETHVRANCARCGRYIRFVPRNSFQSSEDVKPHEIPKPRVRADDNEWVSGEEYAEIYDVRVVKMTENGVLVCHDDEHTWVPKSVIKEVGRLATTTYESLWVKRWFLVKEGMI